MIMIAALVLVAVLPACSWIGSSEPAPPPVTPDPKETVVATLFFSDPYGDLMVIEEREVVASPGGLPAALVRELIAGPLEPHTSPTIPRETRLLGVEVVDGTAFVNFSRELIDRHWGGSTGELMTVRSVVFTLTRRPGIERVQFMIEGVVPPETLLGHLDAREPFAPDLVMGMISQDPERLEYLQERADQGHDAWLLDPMEALVGIGPGAGLFIDQQDVTSLSQDGVVARAEITYAGHNLAVTLVQPIRSGAGGIWSLLEIAPRFDD